MLSMYDVAFCSASVLEVEIIGGEMRTGSINLEDGVTHRYQGTPFLFCRFSFLTCSVSFCWRLQDNRYTPQWVLLPWRMAFFSGSFCLHQTKLARFHDFLFVLSYSWYSYDVKQVAHTDFCDWMWYICQFCTRLHMPTEASGLRYFKHHYC